MKRTILFFVCLTTVWTVCLHGTLTVLSLSPNDHLLAKTPDAGIEYQDMLIFLGESTTAHLKSRGVLSGGRKTAQVLANESGTMLLSKRIKDQTVIYPKTGEKMTIAQAIATEQPAYTVLSFGLNGILGFSKNTDAYLACYQDLIDLIRQESPRTAIIIQTVYPVNTPKNHADWHFSESAEEINQKIKALNALLPILAERNEHVKIADTASVLRDEHGALLPQYDAGDGIHLTADAYKQILAYLRTHAYHLPTPLPLPKEYWRKKS